MKEKLKLISIKLPLSWIVKLKKIAEEEKKPYSVIIREILYIYFKNK